MNDSATDVALKGLTRIGGWVVGILKLVGSTALAAVEFCPPRAPGRHVHPLPVSYFPKRLPCNMSRGSRLDTCPGIAYLL